MTIEESFAYVNFVLNKEQQGAITADNFNALAPLAQLSLINNRLQPQYDDKGRLIKGFGVNDKIREEFRPLLKNPQTIAVSSGVATYPGDYLYMDAMTTSTGKIITEATPDEIAYLNSSQIKAPSTTYPKYVLHQDGFNIYPTSITSIKLAYLRKPATPIRNYTTSNDRTVYAATGGEVGDGTSQDFELDITTHVEICMYILSACGVNLNLDKVVAYSEAMKQQRV